jgi:chitodextrinase
LARFVENIFVLKIELSIFLGVTNTALNGFSQTTSSQLPTGTWENGVFDYDHLKKSFIPSYNRYWDEKSKVPYLFSPSTSIWISYDDLESIKIKNDYIKQKRLGGAFFWELSCDRQAELIDATFNTLSKDVLPSTTNRPLSTSSPTDKIQPWKAKVQYKVGQRVTYQCKTYRSIKKHKSERKKTPDSTDSLWQLETQSILAPSPTTTITIERTTKSSTQINNVSEWKSYKLYSVDDQVTYQGKTYRCRQAHMSLTDWMPPVVPALWLQI